MKAKSFAILFSSIVLIIGILFLVTEIKSCNAEKKLGKTDTMRIQDFAGTQQWKDKYDQEHARAEATVVENTNLKAQNKQLDQKIRARAARLQVNPSQIQSMTDLQAVTRIDQVAKQDTTPEINKKGEAIKPEKYTWADKYDTAHIRIDTNQFGNKEAHLSLTIIAPIKTTVVHKGNFLRTTLGLTKDFVDGSCDNPNVRITGISHTQIKTKKTVTFVTGIVAGALAMLIFNVHR